MSKPVKRDAATQGPEEFQIKRPTLKRAAKAEEILASSSPPSLQHENPLKRRLSSSPSSANQEDIEQIERNVADSKTQSIAAPMLSPPPAAAGLSDLPLSGFSTPRAKHPRQVSFSPSPGLEKGSPRSRIILSPPVLGIANERLQQSKLERIKKLQAYTDSLSKRIEALEKDLQHFGHLAFEYWAVRKETDKANSKLFDMQGTSPTEEKGQEQIDAEIAEQEGKLESIEKQVREKEKELNKLKAQLLKKFEDLNLVEDDFSGFYRASNTPEEHLPLLKEMLCEQLANKCVNRRQFLVRITKDIEKSKADIVKGFYDKNVDAKTLEEISFNPILSSSETHNRGEVATKIEFFQKNKLLFVVYYKPRDAKIDAAVIDFFKAINKLPDDSKSLKVKLPEYQIVSFATDSASFSIWEYIDGKSYEGRADVVISHLKANHQINSDQEKILLGKLRRLESVCQPIALSDLHTANVLFRNIATENPEIVPIDLESIQEDAGTGLYQDVAPTISLTSQESDQVAKFRSTLYSTQFRLVPMATGELEGVLLEPTLFAKLAEDFILNLQQQGYKFLSSKEGLYHLLLDDFLNNDIPYLVSYENSIFYGSRINNNKIAEKNLEQGKNDGNNS